MDVEIKTDSRWKPFLTRDEVPQTVLMDQFDYHDEDETYDGYFQYKGSWYHLDQFMRTSIPGWDGAMNDSFFSGVVIQLSPDGEEYRVGTFFSKG
jgi:hypothetical protein